MDISAIYERKLRMSRLILILTVILSVAAASQAKGPKFNVDFSVGWDGCYRPMEWTPVEVGIGAKLSKPFGGTVTLSAQQDDLTRMTVSHKFVLTPDLPLRMPLVTRFAFAASDCMVQILDHRGRTRWRHKYELWNYGSASRRLTAVGKNELLIGMVGRRVFGLVQLPNNAVCRSSSENGRVYLKQKLPRLLPWDWTGYQSLDLLVLYDPDLDLINAHQGRAIARWVSNGGKLLVVLGGRHLPAEHPIAKLLPVKLGKLKHVTLDAATVNQWGCNATEGTKVACRPMKPKPAARIYNTAVFGAGETVFSAGFVGFGKVGVLAFDPSALKVSRPKYAARFWTRRFATLLGSSADKAGQRTISFEEGGYSDSDNYRYDYETGLAERGANAVLEHLLSIKELRPLSIWWVIGLLTLLAVLLGPVDYFVLKRLDRQPMTWLTSSACIVLFTAGAYYGVQALRAGDIQLRVVSVIDGIEGNQAAWSTTYAGLFAPDSDDYKLENLKPDQWWSGVAPVGNYLSSYNTDFGGRNIYCLQHDGSNLPYSMPINIWSMQCLLCESPAETLPITATVERTGEEVVVRITNLADCPIARGCIRLNDNMVMDFAGVPAKSTRQFTGQTRKRDNWNTLRGDDYSYYGYGEYGNISFTRARNTAYFARGTLRRSRAIEAYLKHGAAVVCVEYDQPDVSFGVKDRKCKTDHIRLVRLVVFLKEEG